MFSRFCSGGGFRGEGGMSTREDPPPPPPEGNLKMPYLFDQTLSCSRCSCSRRSRVVTALV